MKDAETLSGIRDVLESAIAQSMTAYGVTPSVGRIYSVLYFSKSPMTQKEIEEHVAMSKASISNGMRELLETEMVSKIWKKGTRQDHYIAEKDFFRNFLNFYVKMIHKERNLIMKAIRQTEPELERMASHSEDKAVKQEAAEDLILLKESKRYLDWTKRLADAMESEEIYEYFPKGENERRETNE
jgi:DNA-binding transcriptional regulator GbsR (MarR family)